MSKKKILLSGLFYPFAMLSYFRRALERRDDVELFTAGFFTGQSIPWNGNMTIPNKYLNQIDLPIPSGNPSWKQVEPMLPWKPDLALTIDAGWFYSTKPDCLSAHVATDPHVLNSDRQRTITDYFFNMQYSYMKDGDNFLSYAFDPSCHFPTGRRSYSGKGGDIYIEEYDAVLIGLHYPNRNEWVERLIRHGVKVNYRIGDIYDEYREENNKAYIGLNWSSLNDVTARVFEIMAMRLCPVLNRLPGLDYMGFEEDKHYLGFSSMDEATEKVLWAKNNREYADKIATNAYHFVHERNHHWDARIDQILETVGLV